MAKLLPRQRTVVHRCTDCLWCAASTCGGCLCLCARVWCLILQTEATGAGVPVNFFITFGTLLDSIKTCPLKRAVQQHPPTICVSYIPAGGTKVTVATHLVCHEAVRACCGMPIECPAWVAPTFLKDYIRVAEQVLKTIMERDAHAYVLRRQFMAVHMSHFGSSLIEYTQSRITTSPSLLQKCAKKSEMCCSQHR